MMNGGIESESGVGVDDFQDSRLNGHVIPSPVEVRGPSCLSLCKALWSGGFESISKLGQIEQSAMDDSGFDDLVIPSSVEVLGSSCKSLISLRFESL
jgi:hypothetical protein